VSSGAEKQTIALLGLRCSGKTTVGRLLAGELGLPFVDLDEELLRAGRHAGWRVASVGELLVRAGPAVFRDLEAGALRRLLEPSPRLVLAAGGGVVERSDNRVWLARVARCVFLSVPLEVLAARLAADPGQRPPLLGVDAAAELVELRARREPHHRALAEVVIECGDAPPAEVVRRIRSALEARSS
jgi:shikimate kinase